MGQISELTELIAASLFISPCDEKELFNREFLKTYWCGGLQRIIMHLEKEAIYYKGDIIHIKIAWAKKNLKGYGLNFDN